MTTLANRKHKLLAPGDRCRAPNKMEARNNLRSVCVINLAAFFAAAAAALYVFRRFQVTDFDLGLLGTGFSAA